MRHFLFACAGGALGAGSRHLVNVATVRLLGLAVPWATLCVNVVGSFVMGCLTAFILARLPDALGLRIFLATGFLGGFTTFSAFSLDAVVLAERGAMGFAMTYALASVVLSVGACWAGLTLMRTFLT